MSVLTKGLAMDFIRQGRKDMAITSIWPAVVCTSYPRCCVEPADNSLIVNRIRSNTASNYN
jgi:hypothetical protein